jgi:hypothetical protein
MLRRRARNRPARPARAPQVFEAPVWDTAPRRPALPPPAPDGRHPRPAVDGMPGDAFRDHLIRYHRCRPGLAAQIARNPDARASHDLDHAMLPPLPEQCHGPDGVNHDHRPDGTLHVSALEQPHRRR